MKNPHDINYIGPVEAEWVDPKVELPPEGSIIIKNTFGDVRPADWIECPWPFDRWVAWLRIGGPSDAIPHCKCDQLIPGLDAINSCVEFAELHHMAPYDQPPFVYCPWCGGSIHERMNHD